MIFKFRVSLKDSYEMWYLLTKVYNEFLVEKILRTHEPISDYCIFYVDYNCDDFVLQMELWDNLTKFLNDSLIRWYRV